MSLRSFHILFILLSIGLTGWLGFTNLEAVRADPGDASALFWCRAAFAACGLLFLYGIWFVVKTKKLLLPLLWLGLLAPGDASACAVCMGDANSNLGAAANGAIFVMLGLLALVLGSLGWFMVSLARRARMTAPAFPALAGFAEPLNTEKHHAQ
jgi:hypothetical protein